MFNLSREIDKITVNQKVMGSRSCAAFAEVSLLIFEHWH
jgi:hypothetical protein